MCEGEPRMPCGMGLAWMGTREIKTFLMVVVGDLRH